MRQEDKQDKLDAIRDAQEKIYEAIDLLNSAVGDDGHAKAYLIDQLKTLAGNDHGMLCSDFNCDKLIEQIEEDEEDE